MSSEATSGRPAFDIIVFGASGFTGRLVVEYLAGRSQELPDLRWAVAGRNESRLREVLRSAGIPETAVGIVVADSADVPGLTAMAASTRVVLTTVGPYARYGDALVDACIAAGTDYCDLCGEVQWMRRMIDSRQQAAAAAGARILMSCGFDSIPSDLGVQHLQSAVIARDGEPCSEIRLLVRAMKGGASGGTFASMLNAVDEARRSRETARILADPYALNPIGERHGPDGHDQSGSRFDPAANTWTAPFIMASVNSRVVRRTNALLGYPWGRQFRYSEAVPTGTGVRGHTRAMMVSAGLKGFVVAAALPLTRKLVLQRMLPKPGEGPSQEQRQNGYFKMALYGSRDERVVARLDVTGDRDPGYGSTSKMLAETALALAGGDCRVGGGFWTPAAALGDTLRQRLVRHAGLSFDDVPAGDAR